MEREKRFSELREVGDAAEKGPPGSKVLTHRKGKSHPLIIGGSSIISSRRIRSRWPCGETPRGETPLSIQGEGGVPLIT